MKKAKIDILGHCHLKHIAAWGEISLKPHQNHTKYIHKYIINFYLIKMDLKLKDLQTDEKTTNRKPLFTSCCFEIFFMVPVISVNRISKVSLGLLLSADSYNQLEKLLSQEERTLKNMISSKSFRYHLVGIIQC